MYSENMKFIESHEWVKIDEDSIVSIGITDHAQSLLGDIVYIELPKVGQQLKAKEAMGVIESVKSASDLYAPVSGEVIEVNELVATDPSSVNHSPHGNGWLIKVKLSDFSQVDKLIDLKSYKELISAACN